MTSDYKLTAMITTLKELGLKVEDQGHPSNYNGVKIKKNCDGTYKFSQLALIDSILNDIDLKHSNKVKPISMSSLNCLHAHLHS